MKQCDYCPAPVPLSPKASIPQPRVSVDPSLLLASSQVGWGSTRAHGVDMSWCCSCQLP